ncbi:Uma2 family endonuclease [Streptomyces sp. B1866]|uniref:Uma2 family endonuclease n=1 Tax=Streptomyces sp. B1866 TaxID=3075431 RepID=UPI00289226FC|nr:Uma2 family endonuclease [Streptomyces sp. B1866]MDT3398663.1 Uma2 family endonuclease [Streptomyces sp. B1866]
MSALTVDHISATGRDEWDDLVRLSREPGFPEGCKVEIIEGIITVAPPPSNNHNRIADKVQRRLYSVIPEDWGIFQTLGVIQPAHRNLYIPDLAVVPHAALDALGPSGDYAPLTDAELVVEITSKSNARHDRKEKLAGYARAGVPLYLLVDAWVRGGPVVTLFGNPESHIYQVLQTVGFGKEIHLPKPFDLTLDTAIFPVD